MSEDRPSVEALLSHQGWVRALALSLVATEDRADDVAQETWLTALRRPPPRAGAGWLARVVRSRAADLFRSESRRASRETSAAAREEPLRADELAAEAETCRILADAVCALTPTQREVVLLHYYRGLTRRETAESLGVPLETVRTRLRRALAELRTTLDGRFGEGKRWRTALAPVALAATGRNATAGTALGLGGLVLMSTKAKIVAGVAVLMAVLLGVWSLSGGFGGGPGGSGDADRPVPVADAVVDDNEAKPADDPGEDEAAIAKIPGTPGGGFAGTVYRDGRPCEAVIEAVRTGRALSNFSGIDHRQNWVQIARAGPDGTWHAPGLPCGMYRVRATARDGRSVTIERRFRPTYRFKRLDLVIREGGEIFRGRAVWADGKPFRGLLGATPASDEGGELDMRPCVPTGTNGEFLFSNLPAGLVRPYARIPGKLLVEGPAFRIPREKEVVFVLDEGLTRLDVRVVADADGSPIAGAVMYSWDFIDGPSLGVRRILLHKPVSDAAGRIRTWLGSQGASVDADGFASGSVTAEPGETAAEVRLKRAGTLEGRVVHAETGKPVEAVVRVRGETARSGPDGRFRIEGLYPAKHVVFVRGGGWASPEIRLYRNTTLKALEVELKVGKTTEVELKAEPTGSVRGRALTEAGEPVAGVEVSLDRAWRSPGAHHGTWWSVQSTDDGGYAVTDADGSFEFEDLLPGMKYYLQARGADGRTVRNLVFEAVSGATHEEDVVFKPLAGRWEVTLLYEDGSPLAGALLGGSGWSARTDAEGKATVGAVEAGKLWFQVEHETVVREGYAHSLPEEPGPLVLRLPRAHVVGGTVLWPDGRPAVNARIGIQGRKPTVEIMDRATDSDGRFRILRIPAVESARLFAHAVQGDVTYQVQVDAELDRLDHVLKLEPQDESPGTHPVAHVLGPDGQPVERGEVRVFYAREKMLSRSQPQRAGLREGTVRVWLPHEQIRVWLEVFGARRGDALLGPVFKGPFTRGQLEEGTRLDLPVASAISGRVTGRDGRPVAAAVITAIPLWPALKNYGGKRHAHGTATTLADGDFRIEGLGEIPYRLEVKVPEPFANPAPIEVGGGSTGVAIRVNRSVSPTVTVTGPDGSPPGGIAGVSVYRAGSKETVASARTDEKGRAVLRDLDPDEEYRLWVWAVEGLLPRGIDRWKPRDTEIRLDASLPIAGVVAIPAGRDTSGDKVYAITSDGERSYWSRIGEDGTFRIDRLPKGTYVLKVVPLNRLREDPKLPGVTVTAGAKDVRLVWPD